MNAPTPNPWPLILALLAVLCVCASAAESQTKGERDGNGKPSGAQSASATGGIGGLSPRMDARLGLGVPSDASRVAVQRVALWLARCAIGEEGWDSPTGHLAIMHVLRKRHAQAVKRYPGLTLTQQTRAYCKCLNSDRLWVRSLNPPSADGSLPAPLGWPAKLRWDGFRAHWQAALALAKTFRSKRDPCPRAMHFGSPVLKRDVANAAKHGMIPVSCGDTRSVFYRLPTAREGRT